MGVQMNYMVSEEVRSWVVEEAKKLDRHPGWFLNNLIKTQHINPLPSKKKTEVKVVKPEDSKAKEMQRRVDKVLDYLNQATGRKFAKSPELTARIKDGNTFDQFRAVIDYKANEWMGGDMQKYIRPQTLFNASKFQGYLADCEQGVPINSKEQSKNQREAELDEWMGGGQSQGSFVIDND